MLKAKAVDLLPRVLIAITARFHGVIDETVQPAVEREREPTSDAWTLTLADQKIIAAKGQTNRLSFAVLLVFFRVHGRFPREANELAADLIADVAQQIRCDGTSVNPMAIRALRTGYDDASATCLG